MSRIGYARVSSAGQSLEIQLAKLKATGCTEIFSEKKSGTKRNKREELKNCMKYIRKGDVLVITKLDRLARSMVDLMNIKTELKDKGATLEILDQPELNESSISGDLMFNILGAIAQFETAIRSERQQEGVQAALAKGVKFGVKSKLTPEQVEEMKTKRKDGVLIRELMVEYDLSKASVYRLLDLDNA